MIKKYITNLYHSTQRDVAALYGYVDISFLDLNLFQRYLCLYCSQPIYGHMLKVITCFSLVPKVTTVEHIKDPAYSQLLLPGERTAERE